MCKYTHTWYSALFSNVSPPARDAQVSMCGPVKLISTWKVFRTSWRSGLLLRAFGQLNRTSLSKRRGSDTVWPPPASGPVDRIPNTAPSGKGSAVVAHLRIPCEPVSSILYARLQGKSTPSALLQGCEGT
jgi:hypothetical protein